ncbi:hypothetical protein AB0J83_28630 [Actinoplanes sp. NPDC049596]|uniref:hypothetical protein n=1 Tax=unclassified Actinoplanes TaxID=2626549 RepID=UPI00342E737B
MSAAAALALLLDRSIARIAESAADAALFDRQEIVRQAGIWDNNALPLIGVMLSRPAFVRERRAAAALRWMAAAGPGRRAWMSEQAGSSLVGVLGPPPKAVLHFRDYRGHVQSGAVPLSLPVVEDYDLTGAEVVAVRVERAGSSLQAQISFIAARRFAVPSGHAEAVLTLTLADVWVVELDNRSLTGLSVAVSDSGVEIGVGDRGRLRAASGTVRVEDDAWHLSQAGRAADAVTPQRVLQHEEPKALRPQRFSAGWEAGLILREAMLEIRGLRSAANVGRLPVAELQTALAGAGTGLCLVAAQPRRVRDRAFRELAESWFAECPILRHRTARHLPPDHWLHWPAEASAAGRRVMDRSAAGQSAANRSAASRSAASRSAAERSVAELGPAGCLPRRARLTLARYSVNGGRRGSAVVNFVDSENGALRAMEADAVGRFVLNAGAFAGPHPVLGVVGKSISLGDVLVVG